MHKKNGPFFMKKIKPFLSIEDQILHLEKFYGIKILDKAKAELFLRNNNYYRIRGYFYPLNLNSSHSYTLEDIERIYNFDALLRNKLDFILSRIEIWARTAIAYYHTQKYGPLGYLEDSSFFLYSDTHPHSKEKAQKQKDQLQKFKEAYEKAISHNENLDFVQHHTLNYEGQFPLWVLVEVLSFGTISKFYQIVERNLVNQIIKSYFGKKAKFKAPYLINWLQALTILRNICSHRGRLFRRPLSFSLQLSTEDQKFLKSNGEGMSNFENNLFGYLFIAHKIYPDSLEWNTFIEELAALSQTFNMDMANYGFPPKWAILLKSQ